MSGIPRHLISKLEVFRIDIRRSLLRHLLKSNATPSDSEVVAIHALITDAEASIEELHHRFPARDRASQVIESQLLKIIEAHRALLSPVRYLPSEILQEIFLHYADNPHPYGTIATMPWRLGHISHRWRKIALSLPSLWDNIPKINILLAKPKQSYVRALICLIQRSGTSPTLKFDISGYPLPSLVWKVPKSPIINEIMLHSERIEQLHIEINKTIMPLFQGFKGRLPNLRILRVFFNSNEVPNLDVFGTAPALRQVAIGGSYQDGSVRILLPWSQITHFEEQSQAARVGQLEPLSSLHSLTYLNIDKRPSYHGESESVLLSPYRPTTLPNLRTLRILIHDRDYKEVDLFLESLTIPAVEVMKILYVAPLIPHLISMFSGSHGPSRLQKLALRTIRLKKGELSTLLKLTPHLVELDIDVPPVDDLLSLIYDEGGVMLVPMLQALYMHSPVLNAGTQTEHFDALAHVRCELGTRKDSEDSTMPSLGPGTCTTLHTLRLVFYSAGSRDSSQKILNNWTSSFTPEEAKAIDMIRRCSNIPSSDKFFVPVLGCNSVHMMIPDQFLACIEHYEVTSKVLLVGIFFWMLVCGISMLIIFYSLGDKFTH